jgi:DNA-binding response OmpR family regulator
MIRVLYVDDEPDLLGLGKIFLEEEGGFVVDTAPSAEEALTFFHTHQYDAIVSDFQMPDMDGIDFLRAIRAHSASLPVILFTGKGREDVVIDAINNGADYYIEKGGDPAAKFSELRQKIEVAVERWRALARIVHYNRRYAIMSGLNSAVLHTIPRRPVRPYLPYPAC